MFSKPRWVLEQLVSHPMATVVGYAALTGYAIGNKPTQKIGLQMASYGIRSAGNLGRGALFGRGPGFFGTKFVRGGSWTLRSASGSAAGGYLLGSAILVGGMAAAEHFGYAPEGSTGHSLDFVTGQADNWYDYLPSYNIAMIAKHHLS